MNAAWETTPFASIQIFSSRGGVGLFGAGRRRSMKAISRRFGAVSSASQSGKACRTRSA
jgi:hypothetical protein